MYTEVHCSTPPRMAVVPNSSKFFDRKTCRADFDTEINSKRTRMSVVPYNSDVLVLPKLASKSVQGCTFQNGHGCPWFHAEASFCRAKLVVEQCTRRYIAQHRHGGRWFQTVASYVDLQHPCCKLPCEFCKSLPFAKHRFCLTRPPSVAILNKNLSCRF